MFGVAYGPGCVGDDEADDEAEGLVVIAGHECFHAGVVEVGGLRDTSSFDALDGDEREALGWADVFFSGEADAVAEVAEAVDDALCSSAGRGVVPAGSVGRRIEAGVEFGAAGIAHCDAEICVVECHSFACEAVDGRGADVLATVEGQFVVGAVVGDDDEEVGLLCCHGPETERRQDQEHEFGLVFRGHLQILCYFENVSIYSRFFKRYPCLRCGRMGFGFWTKAAGRLFFSSSATCSVKSFRRRFTILGCFEAMLFRSPRSSSRL